MCDPFVTNDPLKQANKLCLGLSFFYSKVLQEQNKSSLVFWGFRLQISVLILNNFFTSTDMQHNYVFFLPLVCFYHSVECTVSFHAKIQVVHNSHKVIMFAMNQDLQTKYCKHTGDTTTVAMHRTLTASIRSSSPLLNDISSSAFLINTVPWNKPIIHCQKQKRVCTCNGMCVCVSAQSQLQRNSQTAHTESPPARHRGEGREREQWPIPKKLSLKIETVLNKNEIRNLSNKLIQMNPLFFQVEERKKTTTSK